MLAVKPTGRFSKDLKLAGKRNYNVELLKDVVRTLAAGKILDKKYQDHSLEGKYKGSRECHITSDWLLIYKLSKLRPELILVRTGAHSDLF